MNATPLMLILGVFRKNYLDTSAHSTTISIDHRTQISECALHVEKFNGRNKKA